MNYIFQLLYFIIDEEIESNLLLNNQIYSHNTMSNNRMSIFLVNRTKTKHYVLHLHNGMISWNSLLDIYNIKSQHILFDVQKQSTEFLSRKILVNIEAEHHFDFF